jgi:uncharacterized membrane protein
MKKITTFLFFIIGVVIFSYTHASAEVIKSFDTQIVVNLDSSVSVTETIVYDSEGLQKHGIFRDITPVSSEGEPMEIKSVSVVDENGAPYQWQRQTNDGDVRLKIGDPERTFRGEKTYVIKYDAMNAVAHGDIDEIYWNVTGSNWPFSIEQTSARVLLPSGASVTQQSCYIGAKGSTEGCSSGEFFSSDRALSAGEGMTVAVGFPSGVVEEYVPTLKDKVLKLLSVWWPLLLPIITFIVMYRKWDKKGRDPKGKGVIVPQYDVPDQLTPLEVGAILHEKVKTDIISAEIVYMAIKGYIRITQLNKKFLKIINNKDYELELLIQSSDIQHDFDRKIIKGIFGPSPITGQVKKISDLKNIFFMEIPAIEKSVSKSLLDKKYYAHLSTNAYKMPVAGIVVLLISFFSSNAIGGLQTFLVVLGSIIVTIGIWALFQKLMPSKTIKGVETKEYLLGLKEYLRIAEKDRLAFHNAPDKNPELFEKLLPYAMVFGVEELWAKEFEGIYVTPPVWYVGAYDTFSVAHFGRDMASLDSFVTKAVSSTPSSSGSGGGGFSGGGGGGGGGGSW